MLGTPTRGVERDYHRDGVGVCLIRMLVTVAGSRPWLWDVCGLLSGQCDPVGLCDLVDVCGPLNRLGSGVGILYLGRVLVGNAPGRGAPGPPGWQGRASL